MKHYLLAVALWGLPVALAAGQAPAAPKEHLPEGAVVESLAATPAEIKLDGQYVYAQVLITAQLAGGDRLDVTRIVEPVVADDLATVSPTLVVRPKKDGQGQITLSVGGKSIAVPLTVSGQASEFQPSFVRDVMPALSKLGCLLRRSSCAMFGAVR